MVRISKLIALFVFSFTSLIQATDSTFIDSDESLVISYGFEELVSSQYIDRGMSNNRGLIFQPSAWLSYNDFSFTVWGNMVATDFDGNIKRHEVDFILSWAKEFDNFFVEPSAYYCIYPNQTDWIPTAETNIKLAYNFSATEIYTNLRADILEYKGTISGDIGFCNEFLSKESFTAALDLNSGWTNNEFNIVNYGITEHGTVFHYLNFTISANYYLNDYIYINPRIEYWYSVTELLKSVSGNTLSNIGLRVGIEF